MAGVSVGGGRPNYGRTSKPFSGDKSAKPSLPENSGAVSAHASRRFRPASFFSSLRNLHVSGVRRFSLTDACCETERQGSGQPCWPGLIEVTWLGRGLWSFLVWSVEAVETFESVEIVDSVESVETVETILSVETFWSVETVESLSLRPRPPQNSRAAVPVANSDQLP